jgi:hypothetical protein
MGFSHNPFFILGSLLGYFFQVIFKSVLFNPFGLSGILCLFNEAPRRKQRGSYFNPLTLTLFPRKGNKCNPTASGWGI